MPFSFSVKMSRSTDPLNHPTFMLLSHRCWHKSSAKSLMRPMRACFSENRLRPSSSRQAFSFSQAPRRRGCQDFAFRRTIKIQCASYFSIEYFLAHYTQTLIQSNTILHIVCESYFICIKARTSWANTCSIEYFLAYGMRILFHLYKSSHTMSKYLFDRILSRI